MEDKGGMRWERLGLGLGLGWDLPAVELSKQLAALSAGRAVGGGKWGLA